MSATPDFFRIISVVHVLLSQTYNSFDLSRNYTVIYDALYFCKLFLDYETFLREIPVLVAEYNKAQNFIFSNCMYENVLLQYTWKNKFRMQRTSRNSMSLLNLKSKYSIIMVFDFCDAFLVSVFNTCYILQMEVCCNV